MVLTEMERVEVLPLHLHHHYGRDKQMTRVEKLPRYPRQRVEILPQPVLQLLWQARCEAARKLLLAKGYTAFPRQDPGCAGSFQDLNEHRISVPVTQALQSGLAEVEAATTDTAHALMQTFLWSRKGPNEEDLMERLSFPSDDRGGRLVQVSI